jgi:hypothetical protein
MSKRFVVVYEWRPDFTTATELADRVLLEEIKWLEEETVGYQRDWIGEFEGDFLTWKALAGKARAARLTVRGKFDGEAGEADARAARRAIEYLRLSIPDLDAIVLVRDADDQIERRIGLEQARTWFKNAPPIVIGLAICERENWVISGFEPRNDDEANLLEDERKKLGFWPPIESHRLTAGKDDTALKSPKRVLSVLTANNWDRARPCWTVTALATLRERGTKNGLAAYLNEVRTTLVPMITGQFPGTMR